MLTKKFLVLALLLSANLGVDAISEKRTKKLYRKAGRWQQKLRDVWALLGVKPFLVQPGEEGDECVLKSKITVDDATDKEDYMLKSTVEAEYVLKGADVFTQGDVDEAVAAALAVQEQEAALADLPRLCDFLSGEGGLTEAGCASWAATHGCDTNFGDICDPALWHIDGVLADQQPLKTATLATSPCCFIACGLDESCLQEFR